jgi:ribosomal protein L3 glutamine methyltransferase
MISPNSPDRKSSQMQFEEPDGLETIRDLVRWGASRFGEAGLHFGHGTDNALDEAAWLVLHALHLPLDVSEAWLGARVTSEERRRATELLIERVTTRKPAAYLTGEAWFAGLSFYVDERVIVPRSPIAELISERFEPWVVPERVHRVLDLCTGSGCIAIAAAMALPMAVVTGAELDPGALEVARINVQRHGLEDRVRLVESDLLEALGGERFDLIVSNPPYVDAGELAALAPEYHHEPNRALAAGPDGLDLVLRILTNAAEHLEHGGQLIVEVGASERALVDAFPALPLTWLEFASGGQGVFVIGREDLLAHLGSIRALIAQRLR